MAISNRILANSVADIYNGVMNITISFFDKTMNALLGEKCMETKKSIAVANANKEIKKIISENEPKLA